MKRHTLAHALGAAAAIAFGVAVLYATRPAAPRGATRRPRRDVGAHRAPSCAHRAARTGARGSIAFCLAST